MSEQVKKIFKKFKVWYGPLFINRYNSSQDWNDAIEEWTEQLNEAHVTDEELIVIMKRISNVHPKWPPTIIEFMVIVKGYKNHLALIEKTARMSLEKTPISAETYSKFAEFKSKIKAMFNYERT